MLNRFQFSRLLAFRRGKRRSGAADEARKTDAVNGAEAPTQEAPRADREGARGRAEGAGRASNGAATNGAERSRVEISEGWSGDDRIEGLLRRHQEQRGLSTPETMASHAGVASEPADSAEDAAGTKVEPAKSVEPAEPPAAPATEGAPRTRTIGALDPAPTAAPAAAPAAGSKRVRLVESIEATSTARVVCIASGKGGTGKSVIASNLALLRARQGERVLLIDFDAGLANAHLLLGLAPPHDVGHVMEGTVSAREALIEGPHGLKLLAGGVGRQSLIDPTRRELDRLFKALRPLEDEFDLIVIDHGAGLSYSTVAHLAASSTLVLVTNHEVTALSDGYALYKRAKLVNPEIRVGLVVNRAPDERLAMDAWNRFRGASHKFLGHAPELIGWVPADPVISQAVQLRKPAVLSFPESAAARAITKVAAWGPLDHARTPTPFYVKARRALR